MFGADELEEAEELRSQVTQLLAREGFHLRKWASNDEQLLLDCPSGNHERARDFFDGEDMQLNVFGLHWDPASDSFQTQVDTRPAELPTKRQILSSIAKLYDPLGWLSSVIVVAKRIVPELWFCKFDWNESLPEDLLDRWNSCYTGQSKLEKNEISRWTGQTRSSSGYELHVFSDASAEAYSTVVYSRILREDDDAIVTLLYAKSKVAPLLPVSISRLEHRGAQLLAKALRFSITTMGFENVPLYCHTNSTVVLAWLDKHPSSWRTFVSNRVAQILKCISSTRWRYVPTEENPADCSSRDLLPDQSLSHPLWTRTLWQGPPWLVRHF